MKKITVFALALLSVCFVSTKALAAGSYKIVNKISIEGNEKWDYIYSDDSSSHLFVSHGTQVVVVDEVTGKVIGKISDLKGVHGIAIAPKLNKGFISTKTDNSVTIFDTKTFEVIKKVEMTGTSPDAILFDSFSQKVFVCNGHSNNVTVLDAVTNEIVATIKLTGNPEYSQSDRKGKIYINLEDASSIAVINATTYAVENVWPLAPGTEPTGLALDNKTHRLFSACANKLMIVVDAETGKVITNLPIGEKVDGAGFDPESKCAFSSNGDATMTVVKEDENDQYSVFANVPTQKGARTIAVNKKTHHIYLPAADFEAPVDGQKGGKMIPDSMVILDIVAE
jgi:YVTN family beta-propeller protein